MTQTMPEWTDAVAAVKDLKDLPDGEYVIGLDAAEVAFTTTSRLKFILTFVVVEGEYTGQTFQINQVVTPGNERAARFFRARMKTLGADVDFLAKSKGPDEVCAKIVDKSRTYRATLKNSSFRGMDQIEISGLELVA